MKNRLLYGIGECSSGYGNSMGLENLSSMARGLSTVVLLAESVNVDVGGPLLRFSAISRAVVQMSSYHETRRGEN